MFRRIALSTALLFGANLGAVAVTSTVGLSLATPAAAAETGVTTWSFWIKPQAKSSTWSARSRVKDDGTGDTTRIATLRFSVCNDKSCVTTGKPGASFSQSDPEATGRYRSKAFTYDGAAPPDGEFSIKTALTDSAGKGLGATRSWTVKADGTTVSVVPDDDVTAQPYISELELTADECGNGRLKATVAGDSNDAVATIELSADKGLLDEDEGGSVDGSLKRSRAVFRDRGLDLGEFGKKLEATESTSVFIQVEALDAKGTVIGTTQVEATAKYGDILIDGVPLEFD